MSPQIWWFLTRASGIVAWLMLTASVLWGILLSAKSFPGRGRPAWLLDLHRWLGGLTVAFVAFHLAALVADSYVQFGLADLAVPYASAWKPGAVALGVIAMWLLVAVELTSLAMKHLPKRAWRGVHLTSYVVFWLSSLHGAFAGTDRSGALYQGTAALSVAAVAWALMYRLTEPRRAARRPAAARAATTASATPTPTGRPETTSPWSAPPSTGTDQGLLVGDTGLDPMTSTV